LVKLGAFSFFVGVVWAELFLKRKLSMATRLADLNSMAAMRPHLGHSA